MCIWNKLPANPPGKKEIHSINKNQTLSRKRWRIVAINYLMNAPFKCKDDYHIKLNCLNCQEYPMHT